MTRENESPVDFLTQEEIDALSYEDGYTRLQEILETLEESDLPLEDALMLYESGSRLASHCVAKLESAELRVREWRRDAEPEAFDEWQSS